MLFFILFGIRRRAQRLGTVLQLCSWCHTPAAQSVIRVRTFFTLFFIPLIPLGSKYRATCTMCGSTVSITKEQTSQLANTQADAAGLPSPSASTAIPAATVPHPNVPVALPGVEWIRSDARPGSISGPAGTTTPDSTNHTSEMPTFGQSVLGCRLRLSARRLRGHGGSTRRRSSPLLWCSLSSLRSRGRRARPLADRRTLPPPRPHPLAPPIPGSAVLSCTGEASGKRLATPTFTVAADATMRYTQSSNCVSGTMLLDIFQTGVSSIPELSLFGCNSLTYPLTPGTYYVVIYAAGDWRLSVSAGSLPSSPITTLPSSPITTVPPPPTTTSPPSPTMTQPTTSTDGGDCTTGYNNTKGIDPSIPAPSHLTATLSEVQTSTTQGIRLQWQQPPGYAGQQIYESTPPGPFANASACVAAGSPGVAFVLVNRHATYRFFVVALSNVSGQTYSPPASVTLTVR